jgi:eukaryotic-like serine/threonine-protein kinase
MFEKLFGRKRAAHERTDMNRRFNLIGRVGQGSMSKVWRATDLQSGRTVAVKVLDREKTAKFEARFQGLNKPSEGEIALLLNHPNIVRTHEFGWTLDDEMFLVMEFVEGVGLALLVDLQNEEMKRYRLRYMIQIGEALTHFHQQGFIHRDVCPRNVMVADEKCVKVIDFGLAVPNTKDFCKPGNRTGTASYLAPELIKRQTTDHRLDVFSYAVTCFEMYTKRFPWDAALTIDAVLQHINKPPIQLTDLVPTVDKQIATAIMKGLASNPDDRWPAIAPMVAEIRDAESRLVQAARAAAARKGQLLPTTDAAKTASRNAKAKASMPRPSTPEAPLVAEPDGQRKEEAGTSASSLAKNKSAARRKRASDDDVDLNEMFGD